MFKRYAGTAGPAKLSPGEKKDRV